MPDLDTQAADLHKKLDAAKEDLAGFQQEMTKMKERMKEKLVAEWPSPWQNEMIVETKVKGRLAEDKDYKALILKIRETETSIDQLEAKLRANQPGGDSTLGDPNPKSHGYMPSAGGTQPEGYMPGAKKG
jgi:hypothetical protein